MSHKFSENKIKAVLRKYLRERTSLTVKEYTLIGPAQRQPLDNKELYFSFVTFVGSDDKRHTLKVFSDGVVEVPEADPIQSDGGGAPRSS